MDTQTRVSIPTTTREEVLLGDTHKQKEANNDYDHVPPLVGSRLAWRDSHPFWPGSIVLAAPHVDGPGDLLRGIRLDQRHLCAGRGSGRSWSA